MELDPTLQAIASAMKVNPIVSRSGRYGRKTLFELIFLNMVDGIFWSIHLIMNLHFFSPSWHLLSKVHHLPCPPLQPRQLPGGPASMSPLRWTFGFALLRRILASASFRGFTLVEGIKKTSLKGSWP